MFNYTNCPSLCVYVFIKQDKLMALPSSAYDQKYSHILPEPKEGRERKQEIAGKKRHCKTLTFVKENIVTFLQRTYLISIFYGGLIF